MSNQTFHTVDRRKIIFSIILIFFAVSVFQLFKMQILEQVTYVEKSSENSVRKITLKPPRGIFFDRNFQILVSNKPSYSLQIIPANYNNAITPMLEKVLNVNEGYINNILEKKSGYSRYLPRRIKRGIDFKVVTWIEENREFLPGVEYVVEMQRDYSFGINGAHVFGYTREINRSQLEKYKGIYSLGDYIGIKGIEKTYETYLRGVKGYRLVIVNSEQKIIGSFEDGKKDKQPLKGFDLVLTLDWETQKKAEQLFKNKSGSLVALNPKNGEILAFVSAPQYDISKFSTVISKDFIQQLRNDPRKPLFNRATTSIYPPGSTLKMLVALIGLESGIINRYSTVNCKGGYQYGNRFFRCHGVHGITNVEKAIEHSCNTFFYKLILDIGLDKFANVARQFGFGKKTGVDLSEEAKGIVPDSKYYNKVYGKNKWSRGNLLSLGIGQGEFSVTTLQLAQYTALLANNGKTVQPHIVRGYLTRDVQELIPFEFKEINVPVDEEKLQIVKRGMYKVVNGEGTAKNIKLPDIKIAGKTGTSQNPHGKDHALFVAFAPYDDPQIAVAVMVENVGFGSSHAAPIAQKIIQTYLKSEHENKLQEALSLK